MEANRICDYCGRSYKGYPGKPRGKRTFCGVMCRLKWLGEQNKTKRVNQKGGLTLEERAKIRKSRIDQTPVVHNTYAKVFGRHEHRIVAENMLGRDLVKGEVVHHINHNKRDNSPENLMVFKSQADHVFWEKHCE